MNRKGWLRVVEVFFAIILIIGILFFQIKDISPGSRKNILLLERGILQEIARNNTLRTEILGFDLSGGPAILDSSSGSQTTDYINARIPGGVNFTLMVCSLTDPCILGREKVFAQDIFITSTLNQYQPRKLKLFVWET